MTPKPQYGLVDFWKNLWETIGPYCQNTMRFHNPFGRGIKRFDVKPMNGLCDRYQVNRTVRDLVGRRVLFYSGRFHGRTHLQSALHWDSEACTRVKKSAR